MQVLINDLKLFFPELRFKVGRNFCWEPETNEISYNASSENEIGRWSILHETGHALLGHQTYKSDFELVRLEVAAWEKAKLLAEQFKVEIDEEHIQDCLDTYRDWLYNRSICPNCTTKCLQQSNFVHYRCFNCHTTWKVTTSRFCRAYRQTKNIEQTPVIYFRDHI